MGAKEEIGKKIKRIREDKGLTQSEAAKKSGIHPNYLARVERGEVNARTTIHIKIAKGLGVDLSKILP